tara:strand:- start:447 stop:881 length:435 start_codon:yes stop_codon:yes gene_type:complete
MRSIDKPYVLYVAEKMYLEISKIKKNNPEFSNINAIEKFIGSKVYEEISSGQFHDKMLAKLNNELINKKTKKKISDETIRLLEIQRDLVTKQLIQFPDLYYAKSHFPLEISQRAFDHLWRMCESYELWCKETNQTKLIVLKIID